MDLLAELARYLGPEGANRRIVLLGCTLLGVSSGVMGSFALLRRQSLLGDAMAHAALPGVCLAFLLTQVKSPLYFLAGAMATGLLGAYFVSAITRRSRIKSDAAIGLVLSVFFGVGVVLLTVVQQSGAGNQAGLDTFLFGKAAFLLRSDIWVIGGIGVLLVVLVAVFFKEFKVLSFDPGFGQSLGFPIGALDLFLTGLVVVAVMIGLQAVGVILMAALLIMPAAAARQWTERLGVMVAVAAGVGAFAGASGAFVSTVLPKMPTGPVMVLAAATILFVSLFCAPRRGLLPAWLRRWRTRRRVRDENLLKAIYRIAEDAAGKRPVGEQVERVELPQLARRLSESAARLAARCRRLVRRGDLEAQGGGYHLTASGLSHAERVVRNHRLWELYLTRRADIAVDHVHRDAEEMEHILPPEVVAQLAALLDEPEHDPHGRPIPPDPGVGRG